MLKLIAHRIGAIIPILALTSLAVFSLIKLLPGDAAAVAAGNDATPELLASIRHELHLDRPFWHEYARWLSGAARLDFGHSLATGNSIADDLKIRFPVTLQLAFAAAIIAIILGLPLGIIAGLQPGGKLDLLVRIIASAAAAIPSFWLGPLLLLVFAVERSWLPSSGFVAITSSPPGFVKHILLPALTLGLFLAASLMRQLRSAITYALDSNYVRTIWAKGARARIVVAKHALRNAMIPAVTMFGLQLGFLLGGTIVTEQIFGIQGVGTYVLTAVMHRDVPVIQAGAMIFAICQIGMSLAVDIAYAMLNPKARVH